MCSFRRIQKRNLDPRFAGFWRSKEREIRNWICNLCNLSQTRAICMTASLEMTCFLPFDKICDYTVQNFLVGSLNSDDGTYKTDQGRSALKLKIILRLSTQFDRVSYLRFFHVTRSSAYRVYKQVCRKITVHLFLVLFCFLKQFLAITG